MNRIEHERLAVETFVSDAKKDRYLSFITSPKNRKKFISKLDHFRDLNERSCRKILPKDQHAVFILGILRKGGAPETCFVMSTNLEIDGKEMDLKDALEKTVGQQCGTILSCIPGRLGYFEGEDANDRYILVT